MVSLFPVLRRMTLIAGMTIFTTSAFGQASLEQPVSPASAPEIPVDTTKNNGQPDASSIVRLPQPIADPTTVAGFQKLPVTDQFESLRTYRNRLVYTAQTLTTQLQSADAKLKDLLQ